MIDYCLTSYFYDGLTSISYLFCSGGISFFTYSSGTTLSEVVTTAWYWSNNKGVYFSEFACFDTLLCLKIVELFWGMTLPGTTSTVNFGALLIWGTKGACCGGGGGTCIGGPEITGWGMGWGAMMIGLWIICWVKWLDWVKSCILEFLGLICCDIWMGGLEGGMKAGGDDIFCWKLIAIGWGRVAWGGDLDTWFDDNMIGGGLWTGISIFWIYLGELKKICWEFLGETTCLVWLVTTKLIGGLFWMILLCLTPVNVVLGDVMFCYTCCVLNAGISGFTKVLKYCCGCFISNA